MSKSKSKFLADAPSGVMETLSETLPDERPITALQIVENSSKCPQGFWPILKTYDEDSDADLWRQPMLFGKRSCRYLCISKSEGISSRTVSALRVVSSSDPPPAGYSSLPLTADTKARAWRKRQICYLLSPRIPEDGPLTDIILCSKLKKAPQGFKYAGEINSIMVCYKVSGSLSPNTSPLHQLNSSVITSSPGRIPLILPQDKDSTEINYENVQVNGNHTPDPNKRLSRCPPERPPKTSALVAELNRLNLKQEKSPTFTKKNYPNLPSPSPSDYEVLNPAYNLQPSRPAPPAPAKKRAPPLPSQNSTLGGWNPVDGVPFVLNSKLGGMCKSEMQYPVIKRRSLFQLNQEYCYNFMTEKQT